jgi:thiosulfate/3-mercaptopyruvate sulfurtransferase
MMKSAFALILVLFSLTTQAVEPVVDHRWLGQNLDNKEVLIVDLRPSNIYEYAHIKGSTNTDINLWRTKVDGIESMLPSKTHIEMLMSKMGATPEHHIVLVSAGDSAGDLAGATRVYWTLEQIGHARKSVLDGGIIAYAQARLPLERGANPVKPTDYKIFRMKNDQVTGNDIQKRRDQLNLIDVRSKAEYLGIYQGAPDERAGTISGSQSLPYDWFSKNGGGNFIDKANARILLDTLTLDPAKPNVVFCHTGHRASLSWFVLHEIMGMQDTILYDGSTREWAKRNDLPIEQKLPIKH